jgi:hypothetical protein
MTTVHNIAQGVRSFTSNAFLVEGDRTVLVDAGNEFDAVERIESAMSGLDALVLTHTHPDHVGNVASVVDAFDVEVWGFDPDHELVDHAIADGETVAIGDGDYRALHTATRTTTSVSIRPTTASCSRATSSSPTAASGGRTSKKATARRSSRASTTFRKRSATTSRRCTSATVPPWRRTPHTTSNSPDKPPGWASNPQTAARSAS